MQIPLEIGRQKQLFIDDYCVDELRGVRRWLNQPQKHPANPLLAPEMPWESAYVAVYGNVLKDPRHGQYRMWYSARSVDGAGAKMNTVCHATSNDGIRWERSRLDLFEHAGRKLTNAVLKGPYIGPTVFHTPDDPDPNRHYRMFVFMGEELLNEAHRQTAFRNGYGVLFSPDGIHWKEYENNPVIQGGDISTCMYDPVAREYIAYPKVHKSSDNIDRRCVGSSVSKNFLHWSAPAIILSADAEDDARVPQRLKRFRNILCYDTPGHYGYPSADIYGMTGFRYESYNLGLLWFYDRSGLRPPEHGSNDDGIINIQLAYQRDGYWQRAGDRQDFLPCGNEGEYDCGMVITAHSVLEVGDELWFYYTGDDYSHGWEARLPGRPKCLSRSDPKGTSINLATIRRDGFISVDALYPGGSLTTKLLTFTGRELEINADAAHGQIIVGILDEAGHPVPGFDRDDCIPFGEDAVRGTVRWRGEGDLASLHGKPVRLALHMRTARLYAFRFR